MATIKKAQFGKLLKKATQAAGKVTIPPGLTRSIKKSQSPPTKLKAVGASEAEKIAHGKKTHLQERPYDNPKYEKESFLEREVKKTKPKKTTDRYGFDLRPDKNGGSVPKAQIGKMIKSGVKRVGNEVRAVKKGVEEGRKAYSDSKWRAQLSDPNRPFPKMVDGPGYGGKPFPKRKQPNHKTGGTVGKMRNGGSLSGLNASNKRMGPVDPKGAFTKVQKKTLAGARGKASLTKDKQLGATKMKMGGKMKKC